MKIILVSGGAGFIGNHLCDILLINILDNGKYSILSLENKLKTISFILSLPPPFNFLGIYIYILYFYNMK